ncbi:MAG: hypothetical protein ACRDSF_14745 [Pseudonocardiaceae bacterium]
MPSELRRLIDRVAPGRSVRELTAAAGVPENRLGYWLRPASNLVRMPTLKQIDEIAAIIGGEPSDVHRALRLDVDGECLLDEGLSDDERALLAAYRQLLRPDREKLVKIARVLRGE